VAARGTLTNDSSLETAPDDAPPQPTAIASMATAEIHPKVTRFMVAPVTVQKVSRVGTGSGRERTSVTCRRTAAPL